MRDDEMKDKERGKARGKKSVDKDSKEEYLYDEGGVSAVVHSGPSADLIHERRRVSTTLRHRPFEFRVATALSPNGRRPAGWAG